MCAAAALQACDILRPFQIVPAESQRKAQIKWWIGAMFCSAKSAAVPPITLVMTARWKRVRRNMGWRPMEPC